MSPLISVMIYKMIVQTLMHKTSGIVLKFPLLIFGRILCSRLQCYLFMVCLVGFGSLSTRVISVDSFSSLSSVHIK